jgi:group II intron reverse transcriptase/maturase
MRTTETILEMLRERGQQRKPLERIYRLLRNQNLLLSAYGKIASNQGALTPGSSPNDTADAMSLERINAISTALDQGTFHWKPVRRRYIPKRNHQQRPLGLPNLSEKLVQEAIRMILEAYYEPRFLDCSHGFRPHRSCHTALKHLQYNCTGTKWWIEGDIKGCFDNLDHTILLKILAQDIKDERFLKLVKQMLQAGYLENWRYHQTYSGAPQGGILSPLLTNIYLHPFDEFMTQLARTYRTPNSVRKINPEYNRYTRLIHEARRKGNQAEAKRLAKIKRQLPVRDPMDPYIRVTGVRYADDFIVAVIGPKALAIEIKQKISTFLKDSLHLTLSDEKTLITHHTRKAHFLGFDITINHDTNYTTKDTLGRIWRSRLGRVGLEVPGKVPRQWRRRYCKKGKPAPRTQLLNHSLHDIITAYGLELRGLYNYYAPAYNVSTRLYPLKWIMNQSLCKTLAAKLNISVRQAAKQFRYEGNAVGLGYITDRPGHKPLHATFGTHSIKHQPFSTQLDVDQLRFTYHPRTQLVDRLQANRCELCGATQQIEVHHIRAMKDVKERPEDWAKLMAAIRRKTLVVCQNCHRKIHTGQYDGPKLTQLR